MSFWPQTIPWKLCDILGLVWSTYKNRWTLFENDLIHLHRYWIINFDLGLFCMPIRAYADWVETFWLHEWFLIWVMNNTNLIYIIYLKLKNMNFWKWGKTISFQNSNGNEYMYDYLTSLFISDLWEFSLILNFMHIRIVRKLANF